MLWDALSRALVGKAEGDFVCPNTEGNMASYESIRDALTKLCKEAGVRRITPHELRHSCTELYIEMGASTEDIRRLLNHKTVSSVSPYLHRTDERLTALANRIGGSEINLNPVPQLQLVHSTVK